MVAWVLIDNSEELYSESDSGWRGDRRRWSSRLTVDMPWDCDLLRTLYVCREGASLVEGYRTVGLRRIDGGAAPTPAAAAPGALPRPPMSDPEPTSGWFESAEILSKLRRWGRSVLDPGLSIGGRPSRGPLALLLSLWLKYAAALWLAWLLSGDAAVPGGLRCC